MRTAAIILNWNAFEATKKCVETIRSWGRADIDTVIVDNASDKQERRRLKQIDSEGATVLFNDNNLGYAGGSNTGIGYACAKGYEAILLLNNDAFIDRASIDLLFEAFTNAPGIDAIGPLIYDRKFEHILNAGGLDIAVNNTTHRKVPRHNSEPYVVDYVSGTVLLARSELFKRHGLLDEEYFFSGEIADFCHRSQALCMIHPGAKAGHDTVASDAIRAGLYTYSSVRNRYLYIHKNLYNNRWRFYPLWWKTHAAHACVALSGGRSREASMVVRGMVDGMRSKTGAIA